MEWPTSGLVERRHRYSRPSGATNTRFLGTNYHHHSTLKAYKTYRPCHPIPCFLKNERVWTSLPLPVNRILEERNDFHSNFATCPNLSCIIPLWRLSRAGTPPPTMRQIAVVRPKILDGVWTLYRAWPSAFVYVELIGEALDK